MRTLRLVRSLLLTAVKECSNILAIPTNPSPKSVLRLRGQSTLRFLAPLRGYEIQTFGTIYPGGYELINLFIKVFVLSLRSGQPIMAAPYISCPGRVLLGEQQVLSKSLSLSKTITYATSCRNNG